MNYDFPEILVARVLSLLSVNCGMKLLGTILEH